MGTEIEGTEIEGTEETEERWTSELLRELFAYIFSEGKTSVLTGPRDIGKTSLAITLVVWLLANGYHVLSNVVMKKCVGMEKEWSDEEQRMVKVPIFPTKHGQAYPDNYYFTVDWAQAFGRFSDILEEDRKAKIVLILDEAAIPFGSGESVFSREMKSFLAFMTLARKFNTATLILAVSAGLLTKKIRESEWGFTSIYFRKEPGIVHRAGWHLIRAGVDPRDIFIIDIAEVGFKEAFRISPRKLPLAKPQNRAKPGDIVFDSKASADFDLGKFPGTNTLFNMRGMISHISRCTSEEVPSRMREYLEKGGKIGEEGQYGGLEKGFTGELPLKGSKQRADILRRRAFQHYDDMVHDGAYHGRSEAARDILTKLESEFEGGCTSFRSIYGYLMEFERGDLPSEYARP